MPASYMSLFPQFLNALETLKIQLGTSVFFAELQLQSVLMGFQFIKNTHQLGFRLMDLSLPLLSPVNQKEWKQLAEFYANVSEKHLFIFEKYGRACWDRIYQERKGELEFIKFFTEKLPPQEWSFDNDRSKVLLDLPSLKLMDISLEGQHKIRNYTVVFAPRAGHHSNIAEKVALYLRDQGLSRMALVEQKCAEEIPLYVQGKRHYDGFEGQVDQYRKILQHLKGLSGYPSHLIAICQPGPLLISTLILNPHLGKTFGSAGSPMHAEGEGGFITDFARIMGENYIDRLIHFFGRTVPEEYPGAGRETFDGRFQVLGFYLLGIDQHFKNLKNLLSDLKQGNEEASQRQRSFYEWYNYVHHFPVGFIRDTYKKIFINNELVRGKLFLGEKKVRLLDYPGSVPIWALGGTRDDITPPLQAIGHVDLIPSVPLKDKLVLTCDGGHMALFRSNKILTNEYKKILEFILDRSNLTD